MNDNRPICSPAQQYYERTGNTCTCCSCSMPPCPWCEALNLMEVEMLDTGGIKRLKEYWSELDDAPVIKPSRPWWF